MKTKLLFAVLIALSVFYSCEKEKAPATVTTANVSNITTNSAQGGGEVISDGNSGVSARGVVWSTGDAPTVEYNEGKTSDGTGTGSFASEITGLEEGVAYYVRAYATNSEGTVYGSAVNFTTAKTELTPTVITAEVTEITATSAICGGEVTADGNADVIARGIVWDTTNEPTVESNAGITTDGAGTGSYSSELTGLEQGTTYYARAYATNSKGTSYGTAVEFTTIAEGEATVITASVSDITGTSAIGGGEVTDDGNLEVTARGIVWGDNNTPTVESNLGITTEGAGVGSFTSEITGLQENTTYYVRAYATNSKGTSYGDVVEFATLNVFTDARDGKVYKKVTIGTQTWMADNLAYETPGKEITDATAWTENTAYDGWCYPENDKAAYGDTLGVLYQWEAAKVACPAGWHLPTDDEWKTLEMALGMSQADADTKDVFRGTTEGQQLKATTGWDADGNGTDDYGFTAFPAGVRTPTAAFKYRGAQAYFWTTSEWSVAGRALYRNLKNSEGGIARDDKDVGMGMSVRCVKD